MPSDSVAGRSAREHLMDAAERLVALHGYDVPLRQITIEAGQRNNSAVTYHFGSRQALMEAVWDRRTSRVNAERDAMMDAMSAQARLGDLRALAEAHVLPMVHEIGGSLPSYWARFNEVALARMPMMFLDEFESDLASYGDRTVPMRTLSRLFDLMRQQVAGGVEPAAALQVSLTVRTVIGLLASWERDHEQGLLAPGSLEPFASGVIDMAVTLLEHPMGPVAEEMALPA